MEAAWHEKHPHTTPNDIRTCPHFLPVSAGLSPTCLPMQFFHTMQYFIFIIKFLFLWYVCCFQCNDATTGHHHGYAMLAIASKCHRRARKTWHQPKNFSGTGYSMKGKWQNAMETKTGFHSHRRNWPHLYLRHLSSICWDADADLNKWTDQSMSNVKFENHHHISICNGKRVVGLRNLYLK